jgi:nicotinate-nucleotide pyrophosphorylase (carboxylating)
MDIRTLVRAALAEDVGVCDYTTEFAVPPDREAEAVVVAKKNGVISGTDIARVVFEEAESAAMVEVIIPDGGTCRAGDDVMRVAGKARGILTAERVALNFLTHLSGIATLTRAFVTAAKPAQVRITDTRKTTPLMRALEKKAVRDGGGYNHRASLSDAVLVKDNHLKLMGDISQGLAAVKAKMSHVQMLIVEVTSLDMAREAANLGVDVVMLDNMTPDDVARVVDIVKDDALIEVSGGVTLENVAAYAACGVDAISVGALTHSAPALDMSLEIR